MIKIISGWSNPGGSTTAHINLTNAFNEFGYECKFYGPHEYHLDKCKSGKLDEFVCDKNDTVIVHFMNPPKLPCKKMIYSCHESDIDPLQKKDLANYSKVHYVSRWQQQYHNVPKSYKIIPNVLDNLVANEKPRGKIGGVVGSIDRNKQTHKSISQALEDGCDKVYLFGNVTDKAYYEESVECLISNNVELYGFCDDKQKMYDLVTDVYQNSIRETWGYVAGECDLTGTKYHSSGMCNYEFMSKEDIVKKWKEIL